jgi:electron transfer flavoprotein alpha subunit
MVAKQRFVALVPDAESGVGPAQAPIAAIAAIAAEAQAPFEAMFVGGATSDSRSRHTVKGAGTVWHMSHPGLGSAARTNVLLSVCEQALTRTGMEKRAPALVLLPAGNQCEEIAARLAVRFDGVALGRCIDLGWSNGSLRVVRAAYGGRASLTLSSTRGPWFGTIRHPLPMREASGDEKGDASPRTEELELTVPLPPADPVRTADTDERMLPLEGAQIVVSGGRGMQSESGFALLKELADSLGAALGGSLPAVDAGWLPVSRQIGQSGKYVTPRLYLAVGISGTPQHLAGISPDARVVAVNKDAQADIFRIADVGVIADWNALLPPLIAQVCSDRARQSEAERASPAIERESALRI